MKIEMGESLGYSFLRHVKNCWLVQTNWKASEHWEKCVSDEELEAVFRAMRQTFDLGGSVFKGTKDCAQFLRQAEIDVMGIAQYGSIHAIDVAFHEAGLNYGGGVGNRVLKKLLRTVLILMAYHPPEVQRHIYFVSPKVHRAAQQPLEDIFDRLRDEYPAIEWRLFTNETFAQEMLTPTLRAASKVADTSELFVRSVKLLELGELKGLLDEWNWEQVGRTRYGIPKEANATASADLEELALDSRSERTSSESSQLQPLVQALMKTLLDDFPALFSETDLQNLMNGQYCKNVLGLNISNLPLIRKAEDGREVSGHSRYWKESYGGGFYVSSQWWRDHHRHNAKALQGFVSSLVHRKEGHPAIPALLQHWHALNDFIHRNE